MADAISIAVPLVKRWEGCRLTAYRCPAGRWTCGYGHTEGVKAGMVWTQQRAEEVLAKDLKIYQKGVLESCPSLKNSPNRLAACISLAYNIGTGAFKRSSVAKYINAGLYQQAADAFLMWKMVGGKVSQGLLNRRKDERDIFLKDGTR